MTIDISLEYSARPDPEQGGKYFAIVKGSAGPYDTPDDAITALRNFMRQLSGDFRAGADADDLIRGTNPLLLKKVRELDLPHRVIRCFQSEGIITIGDLIPITHNELLRMPNFGHLSLRQVCNALEEMGLKLGTKTPNNS